MNFVSFASGSSGNCCLVTEGRTAVLIDAGISLRRIKAGLRAGHSHRTTFRPFSSRTGTPTIRRDSPCC